MVRYFCELSFKGTEFHGWQRQVNADTVQESIEVTLSHLFSGTSYPIIGCGRTDAGVHANQYFFHIDLPHALDCEAIKHKLNLLLPKSIVIQKFYVVDAQLHARFSATLRTYRYFIHTIKNPFNDEVSWYNRKEHDISLMNEAAELLIGKHDFASFAKVHSDVSTTICDVSYAKWTVEGTQLIFEISANRFLRNMVRAIVGTLLEVGSGKLKPAAISLIMAQKNRQAAALSVPPQGLFLWEVTY